ncbi:MAG: preprotein translocase subunit SecE [Bacteroidota bacterium]|jgi:preprotein translocase subunit SecE
MFEKLNVYFKESYHELMEKVSWPTWAELQGSVTVVCVASIIVSIVIYVMDFASSEVLTNFYGLFK